MELYLATNKGFIRAVGDGEDWAVDGRSLADQHVTSLIAREGVILAGTRDGIFRSEDRGESWVPAGDGLVIRHVRWLAYHPDISDREFAGTEPAGLFVSTDGGDSWQGKPEVAALRDANGWFLPYSPEAGCVRGFAFHGQRLYAAVEVGGLLRSDDGGATWKLAPGSDGRPNFGAPPRDMIHPDVHSVAVHPSSPDLVVAPTGGGLYRSDDGGATWRRLSSAGYVRAVWLDPANPDRIIAGLADGVDRNGRIELSDDGGQSWQPASDGLAAPWPRHMVERFAQAGSELLAVLSNGRLVAAPLHSLSWRSVLAGLPHINAVTTMAGQP